MLSKWPVFIGFSRRLRPNALPKRTEYDRFTTIYDEIIAANKLPKYLPRMAHEAAKSYVQAVAAFDAAFQAERIAIAEKASELVRDLRSELKDEQRSRSIVVFLIDHSGSMKGLRMISALIAVECAVQALEQSNIATEILGFTTVNWKGGRSRRAWRWAGSPKNPGRLCDLRHIIYSEARSYPTAPWHLRYALRPDLLGENVDGEALEWAAGRVNKERWDRRVICVISDGAPVDDSTLNENGDSYLSRHLDVTRQALKERNVLVATLLLGELSVKEPDLYERGAEPMTAGTGLLRLIRRALLIQPD
jgi:cobaltochelatase CobT